VKRRGRLTKTELLAPFLLTCATCKGLATAYALPLPGATFCPKCSPGWLGDFLAWRNTPEKIEEEGRT